jgi:uncharacterized protein
MFFSLAELEHHPIHFDLQYAPGEIDLGGDLRQTGSLHTAGYAELLRHTLGELRIRGTMEVALETDCDRCLEPAASRLDAPFDLFYRPLPKIDNHAEIQLEDGEIDLSFYEGDGVELGDALRDFILVSQPMQHLCAPACKGLCPLCGANRNSEPCACAAAAPPSPLSALKDL